MNLGIGYATQPLPTGGQRLLYIVLKAVFRLIAAIPRPWTNRFAEGLSGLWWRIDRRHRTVALENLAAAYPEKDAAWVKNMARSVFRNLSVVAFELPYLFNLTEKNLGTMVRLVGQSNLLDAIAKGRGVVLVSAHLGNWEMLGRLFSIVSKQPTLMITRVLDNPAVHRLVYECRSGTGSVAVPKEKSGAHILRILGQGGVVALLLDQNAAWFEGVYVNFFNRKACTNKGPVKLAMMTGSLVVPLFCIRQQNGMYRLTCEKAVEMVRTGSEPDDLEINTQRLNDILEKWIRETPEQWLWVHRRWRVLPIPDEARKKIRNPPE